VRRACCCFPFPVAAAGDSARSLFSSLSLSHTLAPPLPPKTHPPTHNSRFIKNQNDSYTDKLSYGELLLQNEVEMSRYNLDAADVALARQRFALAGDEARALLAARLPVPAYDMLLKMSHAFNILDARGAVGVTERADCFASMRALAREVTSLWAERREELGHPLGVVPPAAAPAVPPSPSSSASASSVAPRDFVLEIGSEELPPADVESGIAQLRERVPALLAKLRLDHSGVEVEGTPRRLSVRVSALAARQRPLQAKVRGPPAKAAFADPAARTGPTKALEGFLKKNGATLADVTVEAVAEGGGGQGGGGGGKKGAAAAAGGKQTDYVFASVSDPGSAAREALAAELSSLVASLSFKKTMRWDAHGASYPRPMRWLLALHGDDEVAFVHAGLVAGRATRLLRRVGDGVGPSSSSSSGVSVPSAEEYAAALERGRITLPVTQRRDAIWRDASAAAAAATEGRGFIPVSAREGSDSVLDEVANLVESPTVVVGSFDPSFLELPPDVLVTVMRKHQRYFPVYEGSREEEEEEEALGAAAAAAAASPPQPQRRLLPKFVTVANGPVDVPSVAAGNEAVLRARFEDAAFFYREDLKRPLQDYRPKLKGTVFHRDLGSLFDKSVRVEALAAPLADLLGMSSHASSAAEAAALCKCDLATSVVTEMTELAGVMGRHYAERQGLPRAVSEAVLEAALPRFAGDALPSSPSGLVVAVADRLDSLVGLVAAVGAPSATADPYGLRRAAYGMLQALIAGEARLSLRRAVDLAAGVQPLDVAEAKRAEVRDFVARRLEQLLVDGGAGAEAVRAVLAERGDDPALAAATVAQLSPYVVAAAGADADASSSSSSSSGPAARLRRVMTALARPTRIIRGKAAAEAAATVDEALFEGDEERRLEAALREADAALEARGGSAACSVDDFMEAAEVMVPAIDAFFEKVFVMCEDPVVRANRIALLRDVAAFSKGVLDLSALPGF
jgi:glycyl-tRNA synthetase